MYAYGGCVCVYGGCVYAYGDHVYAYGDCVYAYEAWVVCMHMRRGLSVCIWTMYACVCIWNNE